MRVTCEKCRLNYNDVYRWTFCPHDKIILSTSVKAYFEATGHPTEEPLEEAPTDSVA